MICDAKTVMNKSESCLDNSSTPDCFPHDHDYNTTLGIWAICNSIVGSIGNLFIILSMNYSARKKLYVKPNSEKIHSRIRIHSSKKL